MFYSASKLMTPPKVPGGLGFIFDIIIVRIDLSKIGIEETSHLTVDVKFNKNPLKITSSRINVDEFKSGRSYEFTENPSVLRDQLFKNPLECIILNNNKSIGNCNFIWPKNFLNYITDCPGELLHCDKDDIKDGNETVGQMEINVRLQIKCPEFDEKNIDATINNAYHQNDNVIDPNDILFVVGEDKTNSQSCQCSQIGMIPATDSGDSINPTCLDLSDFRTINGRTVANIDVLDSIGTGCCKGKKSVNEYQQIIESLLGKKQEPQYSSKCQTQQKELCKSQTKKMNCVTGTKLASCSSSDSYNFCPCLSNESANDGEILISRKDCNTEKPTKRYCNLCQENITWLPKFVACPKCGFKPINYPKENVYNDELTAEEILQEYLDKQIRDITNQSGDSSLVPPAQSCGQCRCTCRNDKICVHCRIKKSCQDLLQISTADKNDCGKCNVKPSDSRYNVCKTSSNNCRPYIAKVFEELTDHYNIRETPKDKVESNDFNIDFMDCKDSNSLQPKELNNLDKEKTPHNQHKKVLLAAERKKFLVENFAQQETPCKGKVFDYSAERKYPSTKIGHKTCLNGYAGRKNVPRNMGWLWNADTTGMRAGWMPGAIRKPIKILMKHFLNGKSEDCSAPCCNSKTKEYKGLPEDNSDWEHDDDDTTNKPTLHVCKKNGVYYITLRPLKDAATIGECSDDSCADMKPVQFKIIKNPLLTEIRDLKHCLKAMGFQKCSCHKPITHCCCRTYLEKKRLEYQCHKECCRRNLQSCTDSLILSDTSDSEVEFDFGITPPAAMEHPEKSVAKKKKVNSGTQYVEKDWIITPESPQKIGKYSKLYNCAVGQRFGKAFGPYGTKGYSAGAAPAEGIYGPCGFIKSTDGKRGRRSVDRYIMGPKAYLGTDGKFNMANYLKVKAFNKPNPTELAKRRKQKLALLKGANPPLLCMVDRRGKPFNPCATYVPIPCDPECLRDNRIC